MRDTRFLIAILPLLMLAAPADAADITLRGNLISSCILTLTTEGRLAAATDPTIIGSEETAAARH